MASISALREVRKRGAQSGGRRGWVGGCKRGWQRLHSSVHPAALGVRPQGSEGCRNHMGARMSLSCELTTQSPVVFPVGDECLSQMGTFPKCFDPLVSSVFSGLAGVRCGVHGPEGVGTSQGNGSCFSPSPSPAASLGRGTEGRE